MRMKEKVYMALMEDSKLTALLAKDKHKRCIYPYISPDSGSYPILVYSVISLTPALLADGEEKECYVTVRIHILTKDGVYSPIHKEVLRIMKSLDFMRVQTTEVAEKDVISLVTDYKTVIGVDDV